MKRRRNRRNSPAGAALVALALTTACQRTDESTRAPATSAAPTAEPTPFDGLNLGFEQARTPQGWEVSRSDYAVAIDDAQAYEGQRSLRLVHDGIHSSGRVTLPIPAEAARGQHLRAHVQVRTRGVDHGAVKTRLSAIRGDDVLGRAETPQAQHMRGDAEWTRVTVELSVPEGAEEVRLTLDHSGSGVAWFDDITLELDESDGPPPPATLVGRVLDDAGRPVAGAVVAAFQQTGANEILKTDERGRFSLQMPPGEVMVGAGGPGGVAGAQGLVLRPGTNDPLTLTLAKGPQRIHGTVTDQDGRPYAGATALVATDEEHAYPVGTGQDGTWSLEVPAAEQYMAMVIGEDGQRVMAMIDDPDAALASTLNREGAAPAAAVEWIRDHHVPLRTVEAGHGLQDLAALDPMVADATVVGLGEATHGTREFFQLKHRMLEYLVERHGFTVFGIEANRTECRAIDHYVQTGQGDPKEALEGIYFWTWDTQEVLALIEWMREYNESHETTLHFVGFDAQTPEVAARNVDAFVARVDPQAPQRTALQLLGGPFNHEVYEALSSAERETLATQLVQLADRFEREGDRLATAGSDAERTHAREDLKVVQQVVHMRNAPGMESFAARDRAMADNVLYLTERYGPQTKAVLWAHNGHVARSWTASDTMGKYLAEALGPRYLSVGFAFDHGGFQAIAIEGEQWTGLREHVVGPAGGSDIEATLRRAGPERFALPLRELPTTGDAAKWLRSPLPMRQIGAGFSADDMSARVVEPIPDKYDMLMFVEQTTRARPVSRD